MSLRAKLYFGFFGMVALSVIIGGIAIWVFARTSSNLHDSDQKTGQLSEQLMPSSNIAGALSENNIKAGFRIYGYSLGGSEDDFNHGEGFILSMGKIGDQVKILLDIDRMLGNLEGA